MRDPLPRLSVRSKLAITFVGLSLIAYGLGGFLVSSWAERALEEEILARLDYQCRAYAGALDGSLALLSRRTEDFASDGLIRDHVTRLGNTDDPEATARLRADLRRHLAVNKLPLVEAFANLAVTGPSGALLVAVHEDDARRLDGVLLPPSADETFASGAIGPRDERGVPGLVLVTPVRDLDGASVVGRLIALVRPQDWVDRAVAGERHAKGGDRDVEIVLHDRADRRLVAALDGSGRLGPLRVQRGAAPAEAGRMRFTPETGAFAQAFPIAGSGWTVEVRVGADEALAPVSGLHSRFVAVGVIVGVLSALLLFFPMRFVARPLGRLTRAAERLREGDLDTRVEIESGDEIGHLGHAFNGMAASIQERTRSLETVAAELRDRQRDLRAGRDRLEAVISSMHDGLVVLGADGRVQIANAAARPLLDLVERGTVASAHHVCRDGPGERDGGGCFACLFDPGGPPRSCLVDVGVRSFEVHTTLLPADGSGGRGRVLVSREVTDRIQRDEREIHNERLAVLGEVAAVVAHELNNPLASIRMFNQMLAAELPEGSPLQENTEVIGRNTDAATRTIRELLDYATGASPEIDAVDVHDTLEDVLRFLRPLSERAGVAVRLEAAAARPEVVGDEVQLRQVFVNLTLNAIQAVASGGGGEVVLATRDDGERLVVDVRDSGPGVPPEDAERIFRPFFTTKARGEGTGLGLPTARRIAELHGGSLTLVSSDAGGALFRVRLRRRVAAEVPA